ncbi:MAG: hypothetical protein C0506_09525 [Anaerolinea sp.]|nr:hypothetical protein [Anaerolinea sp.]
MTAKEALLELIPELGEEEAAQLLAYANTLYDDEGLSHEEREELLRVRAEMEAGEAYPWPEVKRQLGLRSSRSSSRGKREGTSSAATHRPSGGSPS